MQSQIHRARTETGPPSCAPALSSKQAYDLARFHLERGAQEDYLVWTMIAEFLDAVEKQVQPSLN
jgi:hypothetical protein